MSDKLIFLYWDEPVWKANQKVKPKNKAKHDNTKDCTTGKKGSNKR
jgi:hypothetical protein